MKYHSLTTTGRRRPLLLVVLLFAIVYFLLKVPSTHPRLTRAEKAAIRKRSREKLDSDGLIHALGGPGVPEPQHVIEGRIKSYNKLPADATLREQLAFHFPSRTVAGRELFSSERAMEPLKPSTPKPETISSFTRFPRTIWQTWKVGLDHPDFPENFRAFEESWTTLNPNYNHQMLTDSRCALLVEYFYAAVPDVVRAYNLMPKSILKADFFRYLILFAQGGVYSDIDTIGLKPVDEWLPMKLERLNWYALQGKTLDPQDYILPWDLEDKDEIADEDIKEFAHAEQKFSPDAGDDKQTARVKKLKMDTNEDLRNLMGRDFGLVIGIEADPDRPDWAEWYARRIQFCQWTIMAKPGHPMLREIVARITEITLRRWKSGNLELPNSKDAGSMIMDWTGPGIWTDTVMDYFNGYRWSNKEDNEKLKSMKEGYISEGVEMGTNGGKVDWKLFTGLTRPQILDDVLVLPITSFSPGVGTMGSKGINHRLAYARHVFEGSWKPDDERKIGQDGE